MTRRWMSAFGLMSRIATNPSPTRTWSPSRTSRQNRQSSRSDDPLLRHRCGARAYERPDGRVEEPGRVVVSVAASGSVDEDGVAAPDLAVPASPARRVGGLPGARAALLLHRRRDAVRARSDSAGP